MKSAPHLILLYHFFHPDEVISARLFSDLAEAMARQGWNVTAMPAARLYDNGQSLPRSESWHGVTIRRVARPALKQSSNRGRVLNALTMLLVWSWRALVLPRTEKEVVIVGTDPVLSVLVALPWRLLRPGARIVHWCHDLHPEASIAEGSLRPGSWLVRGLRWLLKLAYRRCDQLVDLGPCMRQLLIQDLGTDRAATADFSTITPWALVEPPQVNSPNASVRSQLFGECRLGCLYSGNLGRAHEFDLFIQLASRTAAQGIRFCFAGRGARMKELLEQVQRQGVDVGLADFASEEELHLRLEAGDIHLVSLRDNWTGTVVPSKFFGALAIGRPVLFLGDQQCALARWIAEHQVGWHLTPESVEQVAQALRQLAENPTQRHALNEHCREIYHQHFSKTRQLEKWHALLSGSPVVSSSTAGSPSSAAPVSPVGLS